jgi:hypothetical protein
MLLVLVLVLLLLLQVADFGLSRMMCEGATHLSTHTLGTITHQPPGEGDACLLCTDYARVYCIAADVCLTAATWHGAQSHHTQQTCGACED